VLLLSRILDTSSYFFFEGPLEYAIDASLDWIAAAGSLLQAARVKKLGPFRLTSALLNSGVNSLLLAASSLPHFFSAHTVQLPLSKFSRVHQNWHKIKKFLFVCLIQDNPSISCQLFSILVTIQSFFFTNLFRCTAASLKAQGCKIAS
jgi:hypothetical protein